MATDQRAKAKNLLASEGYAKGGMIHAPKHAGRPHFQRPAAPGPATMPMGAPTMQAPSLGAAPGVPGSPPAFKKGGKVKKKSDAKPRHFAQGGAVSGIRKGGTTPDGAPKKPGEPAKGAILVTPKFKAKTGIGGGK